ncbi:MAG TPA: sigma-70 family RNA polymerase sigma factor [Phycisphaerae bacterium]|nr:sigma-70 family RNA polymerase sigma factor [Phycisphaerae bacterium]HNU44981.1 sigma-70 family RNA polymerase sigma factor [Phycisphaerae bacterium]
MRDSAADGLLQAASEGDHDALQRLIVHCHEPLRRMLDRGMPPALRRCLDPDDVLQQAYVVAFQAASNARFDGRGRFYRWLAAIVRRKLLDAQRAVYRHKRDERRNLALPPGSTSYPEFVQTVAAQQSTPSQHLARTERTAVVATSLARLTADQRAVIRLRVMERRSVADVARLLGRSEEAIHALTHRSLKKLRRLMGSVSQYLITR